MKQKEFKCPSYLNLADILSEIKEHGYTEEDYENFHFEVSYECCYYEGDRPDVVVIYKENVEKI